MAPSAESVAAGVIVSLSIVLTGCVSTQTKNERAKLNAGRELAAGKAVTITRRNPDVVVRDITVVRSDGRSAVVATLHNRADKPLHDLPILVGVRTAGGRTITANAGKNGSWFDRHVASLAAGQTISWAVTTRTKLPSAARPFAHVGFTPKTLAADPASLPQLRATAVGRLDVSVRNLSDVPQTDLPVYAITREGDQIVGAARTTLRRLDGKATATAPLTFIGRRPSNTPVVLALPTIFE